MRDPPLPITYDRIQRLRLRLRLCTSSTKDSSRFASSGGDKLVFYWDVASSKIVRKFHGHYQVSPRLLLGEDRFIRPLSYHRVVDRSHQRVNCVAFHEEGSVMVSGE